MASRVLLPANSFSGWSEMVADVVTDIESVDEITTVVLHVFDDDEVRSTTENLNLGDDPEVDELAARKAGVAAAVDRLENAGVETEVRGRVHEGDLAPAILDAAESEDVDRIYMYSRKRSPAGKAVFGSTLQRLLFEADVPVVVTPSNLA